MLNSNSTRDLFGKYIDALTIASLREPISESPLHRTKATHPMLYPFSLSPSLLFVVHFVIELKSSQRRERWTCESLFNPNRLKSIARTLLKLILALFLIYIRRLSDTIRRNHQVDCDVIQHTYRVPLLTELKYCSLVRYVSAVGMLKATLPPPPPGAMLD